AYTDRIAVGAKNDRNCAGSFLGGKPRRRPGRHNDIDLLTHQICRMVCQECGIPARRFALDDDVPSLHITEFRELLHEWHGEICAKTSIKEPNFERLLCATG